jgi:hypothetical protein
MGGETFFPFATPLNQTVPRGPCELEATHRTPLESVAPRVGLCCLLCVSQPPTGCGCLCRQPPTVHGDARIGGGLRDAGVVAQAQRGDLAERR